MADYIGDVVATVVHKGQCWHIVKQAHPSRFFTEIYKWKDVYWGLPSRAFTKNRLLRFSFEGSGPTRNNVHECIIAVRDEINRITK